MDNNKFPARLYVLVARESDKAIIIRRGPAKHTCTLLWDRTNNTISVGQWFKGQFYERRADISPDGRHWIYFAAKSGTRREFDAWTAVARSPWLKAIAFYPQSGTWCGGGLFNTNNKYWQNSISSTVQRYGSYADKLDDNGAGPERSFGYECLTVYFNRLMRDGWVMGDTADEKKNHKVVKFSMDLPHKWKLIKLANASSSQSSPPGEGCYWDEHVLVNDRGQTFERSNWRWAQWVDGAIVFTENGCLCKMEIVDSLHLGEPEILHDLNGMKYEEIVAPY